MEIGYMVFLLMSSLLITLICLLVYGYHIDKHFEKIEEKIANLRNEQCMRLILSLTKTDVPDDLNGLYEESED